MVVGGKKRCTCLVACGPIIQLCSRYHILIQYVWSIATELLIETDSGTGLSVMNTIIILKLPVSSVSSLRGGITESKVS